MSWVGGLLLQAQSTPEQGVVESEFLGDWKNQLPEVWRKHVALSALKVSLSYFIIQIPWRTNHFPLSANTLTHRKEGSRSASVQGIPRVLR